MEPIVPLPLAALPALPPLALAVVGHVEMVSFIGVDHLPAAGEILHADDFCELPAGGGAVVAVQMARLTGERIPFFTALGNDPLGHRAAEELEGLGLELHIAWRQAPTRRGLTFIDAGGERTITVIGERLMPTGADGLPWERLAQTDGVFVTATDAGGLRLARRARVLAATPRVRLAALRQAGVTLDALIGSAADPGEAYRPGDLAPAPSLYIGTEAERGGVLMPGGRYAAVPRPGPVRDAYGAGDSFAAGVTTALAAGWDLGQAISLGAHCGAACLDGRGPYACQLRLSRR
ncbi:MULTISPECIES: PfkB family carbohydrate kinase [unclassified Cyanobium]|uniref:PfkB family carbohydrate kinase n=1 Tax=unclassified Cyanobium TaxID=2627006 RepID=UPI0020CC32B2|nr:MULTISPECIES: PfkB family carbohydrate kinase [unclassified Cyanobium]MCP9834665.1 ribokinase [Cyanobium sp. La Preciosa 7G6]MCP9937474.1 ribokinase [Cyanobium sp. Aljojuca 7A6]